MFRAIRFSGTFGLIGLLLAACGGGSSREFETAAAPLEPAAAVATIALTGSAPSLSSDGRQTLRLFATVTDAGNVALAGVPVSFESSGAGSTIVVVRGQTDASGQAEATLAVTDPVNRSLSVIASAAGQRAALVVDVTGTSAGITGPASVVIDTEALFQVVLRDASGTPIAGKPVRVSSSAGNAVRVSPALTNAQGAVDLIVTPSVPGADTLTVSAAGATAIRSFQVSATTVAIDAPSPGAEIVVGSAPVAVRVRILDAGRPPAAPLSVSFSATRGELGAASALTDANGVASTTLRSTLAGRSLVTASVPDGTVATRELLFIADRAAKLEVQASPSTVGVNAPGSLLESSQIIAVVRDLVDNPVRGARVNFSAIDPSAGAGLSSGFALTDAGGRATVTFYPGAIPTGANRIAVTAAIDCGYSAAGARCVDPGTPPTDQILLTASRRALQVRIGTGNEMLKVVQEGAAPVFNELPYGVLVTDSGGNPVMGALLNATVVSIQYLKGYTVPVPTCQAGISPCWRYIVEGSCPSEDLNENLLLDRVPIDEDANRDGLLTPGNVGAAYFGPSGLATTAATDSQGSSVLRLRYLRDRSAWVRVRLRVSAAVPDGTEGAQTVEFLLPVLASDLTDPATAPPGATSPFGVGVCP